MMLLRIAIVLLYKNGPRPLLRGRELLLRGHLGHQTNLQLQLQSHVIILIK